MQENAYIYVLGDGDKVREHIEHYLLSNEVELLAKLSQGLANAINEIKSIALLSPAGNLPEDFTGYFGFEQFHQLEKSEKELDKCLSETDKTWPSALSSLVASYL